MEEKLNCYSYDIQSGFFYCDNIMQEIWKDILGYKDCYQASNLGKIKSLNRKVWMAANKNYCIRKGKILKGTQTKYGYLMVNLQKTGKRKMCTIHRLVLLAFIGESSLQCNHKNGIKTDNRLENLEYCTCSENHKHAFRIGLRKPINLKGEKHGRSKLKEKDILEIRDLYKYKIYNQFLLGNLYNVDQSNISYIIRKKTWI